MTPKIDLPMTSTPPLTILLEAVLVSTVVYSLGWIVYNVYFHPLARFPGSKAYGASFIPYQWALARGNLSSLVKALHDRYGPVVRIGPDTLSFIDEQAWKDIYGHKTGKRLLVKDPKFYFNRNKGVGDIIISNDADHSRMRRTLAHAFSEQALRDQESIIISYIDLLISKLREQSQRSSDEKINISNFFNFTTFDIIGDLLFGQPFGCLASGQYHTIVSNIFQSFKFMQYSIIAMTYPIMFRVTNFVLGLFGKHLNAKREQHLAFATDATQKRQAVETDRKDFMTYILRHNDEKGMTQQEIYGTNAVLIAAGSETTATFLSGAVFHLLKNKAVLDKLTDEIRSTFKDEDQINFANVVQLPYLHAVIEESLRMYPPVPGSLPRVTSPEGDIIAGQSIPGNVRIAIPQFSAYRSSTNFYLPESFIPERWLGDPRFANDNRAVLQPFSIGPRNCLGKNLAWAEMRTILTRLLWNFDMELCTESADWANQKTWVFWSKGDLMIRLRDRGR